MAINRSLSSEIYTWFNSWQGWNHAYLAHGQWGGELASFQPKEISPNEIAGTLSISGGFRADVRIPLCTGEPSKLAAVKKSLSDFMSAHEELFMTAAGYRRGVGRYWEV